MIFLFRLLIKFATAKFIFKKDKKRDNSCFASCIIWLYHVFCAGADSAMALALAHDVSTWLASHLTWLRLLLHWREHAHHRLLLHAHGYTLICDRREHALVVLHTGLKIGIKGAGGIHRGIETGVGRLGHHKG